MSDPQTKTGEFPPILIPIIVIVVGWLLSVWVIPPPDNTSPSVGVRHGTVPSEQVQRALRPPTYDELLDQSTQRYDVEVDPLECEFHYPAC